MKLLGSLGSNRTKVLLTVLHLHAKNGRCTVQEVATGAGLCVSAAHGHLRALEAEGFISWPEGTQGTITPLVEVASL